MEECVVVCWDAEVGWANEDSYRFGLGFLVFALLVLVFFCGCLFVLLGSDFASGGECSLGFRRLREVFCSVGATNVVQFRVYGPKSSWSRNCESLSFE